MVAKKHKPSEDIKSCCECGKRVSEAAAIKNGHRGFCSHECYGKCVGLKMDSLPADEMERGNDYMRKVKSE